MFNPQYLTFLAKDGRKNKYVYFLFFLVPNCPDALYRKYRQHFVHQDYI